MFWKYLKLQQEEQKELDEDHTTYKAAETPKHDEGAPISLKSRLTHTKTKLHIITFTKRDTRIFQLQRTHYGDL
ncbi:hypothetical protein F444_04758 [Phytophthora nicotianae P1976]|uniref:Uncharacterized protein n=1 Tax=Phytophthora nicotianae P1976 TaxID=1317066 RepID=A0A081APL0_PHYNI|nr:hypothetical protein F444_04758 [Phytophthora nicotianae P1976]